ncbi:hypothetical protein ACFQH3_09920 [Haladaptatus sp. GCM10025707]|uniref:hypothetical protein n=1 Tax=unclassified Haladaptatus TaxID=2622732 RepID=UPI0023E8966D|nr:MULTISPECIES: hypothetical protein [unclassified Haladaptatus]
MYGRRPFLLACAVALSGCSLVTDRDGPSESTLTLDVRNERTGPVDVTVTVTDEEGTVVDEETDRIDASVSRAFEFEVTDQREYTVTVFGSDWGTELAWNAATCALLDSTVRLTDESVENSGECVQTR